jgi:hypothetical protein
MVSICDNSIVIDTAMCGVMLQFADFACFLQLLAQPGSGLMDTVAYHQGK